MNNLNNHFFPQIKSNFNSFAHPDTLILLISSKTLQLNPTKHHIQNPLYFPFITLQQSLNKLFILNNLLQPILILYFNMQFQQGYIFQKQIRDFLPFPNLRRFLFFKLYVLRLAVIKAQGLLFQHADGLSLRFLRVDSSGLLLNYVSVIGVINIVHLIFGEDFVVSRVGQGILGAFGAEISLGFGLLLLLKGK
jgi:hypothetical protein